MGLPLPRSARVKVDYNIVMKDPKMSTQIKETIHNKNLKGQKVIEDGLKQKLISERTYNINKRNLEKWVNSSYRKID